jgi:predicted nuclease of predicted toxin-antitoxin system
VSLLLDNNLSPRLVERLGELFAGCTHVARIQLDRATDHEVWEIARLNGHVIVSKDSDFSDLSVLRGSPPKVIWLRLGNCTTEEAEAALRAAKEDIAAFLMDPASAVLELT